MLDDYLGGGFPAGSVTHIESETACDAVASVLARTIGVSAAYAGHRVRFLAPAQGSLAIYRKVLCGMARIPLRDMFGSCTEDQTAALVAACEELRNMDLRDITGEHAGLASLFHAHGSSNNGILVVDDLATLARVNDVSEAEAIIGLVDECRAARAVLIVVSRRDGWHASLAADVSIRVAHGGSLREGDEVQIAVKYGGPDFKAVMLFERFWALA